MSAEYPALAVHDRAGAEDTGLTAPQEGAVVIVGDEADLLALGLVGRREPEAPRVRPHLVLRQLADGKARCRELLLRERPEEVGLILPRVTGAQEQMPARRRVAPHARVVARRDGRRVPGASPPEERAELQLTVARQARDGRHTPSVRIGEWADHRPVELRLDVEQIVRDTKRAGDVPRVVGRFRAAAASEALRRLGGLGPGPDAQGDSDDVVALLDEERGGDGGVDAATHPDDDSLGHVRESSRFSAQCLAPNNSASRSSSSGVA